MKQSVGTSRTELLKRRNSWYPSGCPASISASRPCVLPEPRYFDRRIFRGLQGDLPSAVIADRGGQGRGSLDQPNDDIIDKGDPQVRRCCWAVRCPIQGVGALPFVGLVPTIAYPATGVVAHLVHKRPQLPTSSLCSLGTRHDHFPCTGTLRALGGHNGAA